MHYPKQSKIMLLALTFVCMWCATACGVDRYNVTTDKSKDYHDKDERIYGDGKDQPARQTKNTYPDPADGQARADAIREKFYGKANTGAPATTLKADTTATKPDSTAKKPEEKKKM